MTDIYKQYQERKRKWIAKEAFKTLKPCCIPIYDVMSNTIFNGSETKMTEAYATLRKNFDEYKQKVNEVYGCEALVKES